MRGSLIIKGNRSIRLHGTCSHVQPVCLPPRRCGLHHQARALFSGASRDQLEDLEEELRNAPEICHEARFAKARVDGVDGDWVWVRGVGRIDGSAQLPDDVNLQ